MLHSAYPIHTQTHTCNGLFSETTRVSRYQKGKNNLDFTEASVGPYESVHLAPHTHTHTHPFNGPFSGTIRVSRYQKGKTNLDFAEARDSEWKWHQLGHMQVCTSLQTDNHASTPPLSFLQAGCPSCRPTNSVKALKAQAVKDTFIHIIIIIIIIRNQLKRL